MSKCHNCIHARPVVFDVYKNAGWNGCIKGSVTIESDFPVRESSIYPFGTLKQPDSQMFIEKARRPIVKNVVNCTGYQHVNLSTRIKEFLETKGVLEGQTELARLLEDNREELSKLLSE